MTKLGFIVEGDADAEIVRALVPRLVPAGTRVGVVRAGGKIGILSASPTVAILREKGYDHVFILFDADTESEAGVREQSARLTDMLARRHLERDATVCPIVPAIDAWISAGTTASTPRADTSNGTSKSVRRTVEALDLNLMRDRNASFAAFAQQLESACAAAAER